MSSAVVAIIYNHKGELLLTRRKNEPAKGLLDLPGGFVNLGETVEDALVREIKEELNIDVIEFKFAGTFPNEYVFGGIAYFTEDAVFVCEIADFSTISAQDDVQNFEFRNPTEINIDEIGLLSIKNVIRKLNTLNNGNKHGN
jgi:mutator protein MutT